MADPTQDTLSPEDAQALVHTQQQLYASGDPRATKLYNFIVASGYADKDAQGGLVPKGSQPTAPGWSVGSVLSGTDPAHQAFDRAAQTVPVDTSSAGGFAKTVGQDLGAGATRLFSPVVHPANTVAGLATTGRAALGDVGAQHDLAESMVRPFVQNPSGEAVAALPQAALALAGGGEEPAAQNAIERATPPGGVAGATAAESRTALAKLVPSLVDGPPQDLMTRAVKPGKNNIGWNQDIQTAMPLMKSAEQTLGKPVGGVDDAIAANTAAKKAVWTQVQARLNTAGEMGATIDGNPIADAMINSIDARTALQNPSRLESVKATADTYRRPMSVDDAEDFLQSANKDLNNYYAKNKVGQQVAQNDPEISSTVAEAGALRDALYSKLDEVAGPGAAQLKQAYGALSNVQKELYGRQLVAARQQPESLSEQMGAVRGAGNMAKGAFQTLTGNVLEGPANIVGGAQNIAIARLLKSRNSSDAMIARAFKATEPAPPFAPPQGPQIAGLLPRGAIQTPPPAQGTSPLSAPPPIAATTRAQRLGLLLPQQAGGRVPLPYTPGMSSGEQMVSLMHLLRNQRAPIALPARTSAIPLPPPAP
jgi:hypothetical protein